MRFGQKMELQKAAWQWAKQLYIIRELYLESEATFFEPKLEWRVASTSTINPDEREFVVESGTSMHLMSKTDLSPEELEAVKVSRLPTTVITASGSIDTTEEGHSPRERLRHVRHGPTSGRHSSGTVSGTTLRRKWIPVRVE